MDIQNQAGRTVGIRFRLKFLRRSKRSDVQVVKSQKPLDTFQESEIIVDDMD